MTVVADQRLLLSGEFEQSGNDHVLRDADEHSVACDAFARDKLPQLLNGAVPPHKVVAALARSCAFRSNGQVDATPAPGIATVITTEGKVTIRRVRGAVEAKPGAVLCRGDVIETATDGVVGIVFLDSTVFTLSAGGRMALTEFVYDPDSATNSIRLGVVHGTFAWIGGKATSSDALRIATPLGTIRARTIDPTVGILAPRRWAPTANGRRR